ncbi:hypothetical protein [Frankia sp. Cr1]|uniref:hypothetical protein n=1 Tax=Frankia sp. Cr1 TaxID=3073931 RepID=UPI002AD422E3|nr:hypothetical protein [Frankia sp. Cr1]
MVLEVPLFLQAASGDTAIDYSAREVRQLLDAVIVSEGVIGNGDLAVSQRGAGANDSVDVAAGWAAIIGDSVSAQGKYLCRNTAATNLAISAAPGSGSRTDLVYAKVRDKVADGGSSYDWVLDKVTGTVGGGTPATPASAIPLATILRTAGDSAVTTARISDARLWAAAPGTQVCTRTTRPATPRPGTMIFEVDTGLGFQWTGTRWRGLQTLVYSNSPVHVTGITTAETGVQYLPIPDPGCQAYITADCTMQIVRSDNTGVFTMYMRDSTGLAANNLTGPVIGVGQSLGTPSGTEATYSGFTGYKGAYTGATNIQISVRRATGSPTSTGEVNASTIDPNNRLVVQVIPT